MHKFIFDINYLNIENDEHEFFASSNIRYVVVNILPWIDFKAMA